MTVELVVSAASGTSPSAMFSVQWSMDRVNFAQLPADTFPVITEAGNYVQAFTEKTPYFRLAWAVSGTTP